MKKKSITNFFFKVGWFVASLATGVTIGLLLLLVMYFMGYTGGHEFIAAVLLTAPIGIPIGMYLLRIIFYKTVKRDFLALIISIFSIGGLVGLSAYWRFLDCIVMVAPIISIIVYQIIESKNNRKSRL